MKILITGGTGLLGKALIDSRREGTQICATYVGEYVVENLENVIYLNLDIKNREGYLDIFKKFRPEIVIHTASIGSPDFAEKNKELTWSVNVVGTKNICAFCEEFGAKMVHISSNGIYDGDNAPYAEDNIAKPINFYGVTKLEAENIVQKSNLIYSIVRPILMYGWPYLFERGNIVTIALSKLRKNEPINVYDDVYSNPLFVNSCAEVIWKIIYDRKYATYNVAGADRVSIFELVRKAADVFDLNQNLVVPVKQGYFNELVKRPHDTSYRTDKMEKMLKIQPLTLEEGLGKMRLTKQV